jgi:Baseplate J-like protein
MDTCASNISIHDGMGTTQAARFLVALKPDYFLVDERKEIEFIAFAQKMATHIKFYNDKNEAEGNWSNFFQWESTAILVQLYLWDVKKTQENYKIAKAEIKTTTVVADQKKILQDYFQKINNQFQDFSRKINLLDSIILAKETLQGTTDYFTLKFSDLNTKITSSTNPLALVSNFQFDKTVQQLFGLMHNWKQVAGEGIANQLANYANHQPHFTLYLSFLKLLGIAQAQLNEFTKKHLDFYYKDILQIQPADARPDQVHLVLESAPKHAVLVPKGSIFTAGKNTLGKNKYYASTADQAVNNGALHSFLSNHKTATSLWKQANFIKTNATNTPFNVFSDLGTNVATGLLIASPLFFLSGGDRNIQLKINGTILDTTKYTFWITGEKKVIEITNKTGNNLKIPASEKKIIAYNSELHKEIKANTIYPVLKIIPKPETPQLNILTLEIKVQVNGFKNFIVATDTGLVDINKPFKPFGEFPKSGNGFVIGSNEFFVKNRATVDLHIEPLFSGKTATVVADFRNLTEVKTGSRGKKTRRYINTLDTIIEKFQDGFWQDTKATDMSFVNTNPITEYQETDKIPDNLSTSGYLKVTLDDTDFDGEKFLTRFIVASKAGGTIPVAPTINSIYLDYTVIDTYTNGVGNNPIEIDHILPFGYKKDTPNDSKFPHDAPNGGEIYLGFENVISRNGLSFLVQLAEGTANPRQETATITWSFLNQNDWTLIDMHDIGDETNGLTQSGLVQLTIPEFSTSETTILEESLFWLKITVDRTDAICHFIGVHAQALKAVLSDFDRIGSVFDENTPKETISKLHEPITFIKKVTQPYSSFGGRKKEDDLLLYQRSSERLRHKKRAITSWDYERLILEEFSEVYRVKCLNHYRYNATTISNVSAGYVTLIPIAKSNDYQNPISWKPLLPLGTMKKMQQMIAKIASPHARIIVKTPTLEKIQVKFNVKYHEIPGADTRLYATELKKIINAYLSPWAFGNTEVVFVNAIEISALIQLIDNQSFVDFITDFEVNQIILNDSNDLPKTTFYNVKKIIPMTDFTLFVPNESHTITEINPNTIIKNRTSKIHVKKLKDTIIGGIKSGLHINIKKNL